MEDTLLIGDHCWWTSFPTRPRAGLEVHFAYTELKRGDIIVFRYPVDIKQTFVKRCIGCRRPHRLIDKQLILNG